MGKTIDELEVKCPKCESKVNYIQTAREACEVEIEDGELIGGNVIESFDIDFVEIRCDSSSCDWKAGYAEEALEQMKKAQGIE